MPETTLDLSEFMTYVGRDVPQPEQFNYDVTRDAIRHFAYAVPDTNAVYLDEEFGRTTRWGTIIAPPGYLYAHGSPAWLGKYPGIRDKNGKELSNADNATEEWEFYKPVRPGDVILSHGTIENAVVKHSRKLGECVLIKEGMRFTNQRGELVAKLSSYSFRFDGAATSAKGGVGQSYPPLEKDQFTRNVATPPLLPGTQPTPERRYDTPRFFEDVSVGDELDTWEYGPIMAFDIGRFNATTIGTGYDRIGRTGHIPDGFAPGVLRIQWFGALLSRWGGPGSWVTRISQRNEEWVLVGFKIICGGTVTAKREVEGRRLVDVDIWCRSELGFQTNSGTAQIELESRESVTRSR
ncbi:MaoC family dehydratase N-terminal domain-containing protein [Mesorhizobium sp. CAU 1732]|uniref:FAS1-like dehydratase domain-containing protein n=1 Tax=Mesorhizobium sp. CAU 1732 TaxID=3140358 RepID=UPI00326065EB